MGIFQKFQISIKGEMSKKDVKRFKADVLKQFNYEIESNSFIKMSYKKRFFIIIEEEVPIFFNLKNFYYPTIQFLNKNPKALSVKKVVLDKNARKPVLGGANVMARGIHVNYNLADDFEENEIVFVEINNEIVGVGRTLLAKSKIEEKTKGEAIQMYHLLSDDLYNENF